MSSRTAAGRKRLQQPKPQKTSTFRSPFRKNLSSDAKSPSSPPSLPSSLSSATQTQAPLQQPYNLSDTSDVEDFALVDSSALQNQSGAQWHPQIRPGNSTLLSHAPAETSSRAARAPPSSYAAPGHSRAFNPYPSPPRSTEDIYSRSTSSDSSVGPISIGRVPSPSQFLIQTELRSGQPPLRYGSAPTMNSVSRPSSQSKVVNHALHNHYPSPPESCLSSD